MSRMAYWSPSAWVLALIVALTGCGKSGLKLAPVSGRVTVDGRPLESAEVTFQPDDMKPPSYGTTDQDGRYELGYKRGVQGALVGQHTVRIIVPPALVRNPPNIPERYNKQSELKAEVKTGPNEFNFDMTTEGK